LPIETGEPIDAKAADASTLDDYSLRSLLDHVVRDTGFSFNWQVLSQMQRSVTKWAADSQLRLRGDTQGLIDETWIMHALELRG